MDILVDLRCKPIGVLSVLTPFGVVSGFGALDGFFDGTVERGCSEFGLRGNVENWVVNGAAGSAALFWGVR